MPFKCAWFRLHWCAMVLALAFGFTLMTGVAAAADAGAASGGGPFGEAVNARECFAWAMSLTGWTHEQKLGLVSAMGLVALVGWWWVIALRRSVRNQTTIIREQLKREAAFSNLGRRLSAAGRLDETAEIVVEIGDELIGWDACFVHLFSHDSKSLLPVLHCDVVDGRRMRVPEPPSSPELLKRDRRVIERGADLILRQRGEEVPCERIPFGDQDRPSASLMFVPMRNGLKVVGILSVQSYAHYAYDRADLELLQSLADLSAGTFERIQGEAALKQSEERFRLLFEGSPLGIAVSRNGGLLYANAAHQRMFGYPDFSELKGKSFLGLVAPRERQMVADRISRRAQGGHAGDSYDTVGLRKDGTEFCYHVNVAQMNLVDGEATVAFLADVTERKLAESELKESEERFARAFRSNPVAVSVINAITGRFVDVNESFLRLFEYRREQVIGSTALELGIWDRPEERGRMLALLERHRTLRDYEAKFRSKSNDVRNVLVSVEPIQFSRQECLMFITHDVTERLNLESQLRHSQKMDAIGQLAAGVAHDFNNILTVIHGHTSLLLATARLNAEMTESLTQVAAGAERAANLTRQLLTFSRKQVMQPRQLDLNEVVGDAAKMLQRLLGENISLQFNYSPQLPTIHADTGMMEQIIVNLAVNARDAMPNGGRLIIDTRAVQIEERQAQQNREARQGQFIRLSVTDTGCGMDTATRSRIFEPFFTTKEVGKGTGLGLATVYGIVKQHHGWIEVETAPGKGSTFRVFLPCQTRPVNGTAVQMTGHKVRGGDETILVVEDEPALRSLVTHVLQRYGYRTLEAEHGREALAVWEREADRVDLLLTDMMMPEGMSGWDLARKLKAQKTDLKIIYTSGYSVDLFGENSELREGVNFLAKPYQPQSLAKTVRDCLDARG